MKKQTEIVRQRKRKKQERERERHRERETEIERERGSKKGKTIKYFFVAILGDGINPVVGEGEEFKLGI